MTNIGLLQKPIKSLTWSILQETSLDNERTQEVALIFTFDRSRITLEKHEFNNILKFQ